MSRTVFWSLFAAILVAGAALRLASLDARPMHHDEANQGVRFGLLLETGHYQYDPGDHHGPTLYYLTLPIAWVRGQRTLAALDERTLRIVPALFGAATILLCALLASALGRVAATVAALLVATSPAFTYYSRFYIQESAFVFFALGFLVALGRYVVRPRVATAGCAGALAGLLYATKETSVIVFAAAIAAAVAAGVRSGNLTFFTIRGVRSRTSGFFTRATGVIREKTAGTRPDPGHAAIAVAVAAAVAVVFYSSFFTNLSGPLESVRAFSIYAGRGVDATRHGEPWYYYLRLLAWSSSGGLVWTEAFVLVLAVIGLVVAVRARAFWPAFIAVYAITAAAVFSALPYKTPWNLLPFYIGVVLLAGFGAARLFSAPRGAEQAPPLRLEHAPPVRLEQAPLLHAPAPPASLQRPVSWGRRAAAQALVAAVLVAGAAHLALESWRASVVYAADPRNPYVYAQTTPDFLRLVTRVTDLAAVDGARNNMFVKVVAGPYEQWPLPWYLRRMTRVGYWPRSADADTSEPAPVIVASAENAARIEEALGDRYVAEFYALRPDVLLTLFVERGLWDRFLATRGDGAR